VRTRSELDLVSQQAVADFFAQEKPSTVCKVFQSFWMLMDFQTLGKEVQRLRHERGVSQHLMAEHLAISRATINGLEMGALVILAFAKL
jgi:DNA-binding transcriptional regulator YiaG